MAIVKPIEWSIDKEYFGGRLHGYLQSVFDHALNYLIDICDTQRMITFLSPAAVLLPDSLILSENNFNKLRMMESSTLIISENEIILGDFIISCPNELKRNLDIGENIYFEKSGFKNRVQELINFENKCEKKSDLNNLPPMYLKLLNKFARYLLDGNGKEAIIKMQKALGAGHGLTPSCDDAIVGILAIETYFYALFCVDFSTFATEIDEALDKKRATTLVSQKYLLCACKYQFSKPVKEITEWLFGGNHLNKDNNFEAIKKTGFSSGMDLLKGMEIALKNIERKKLCTI